MKVRLAALFTAALFAMPTLADDNERELLSIKNVEVNGDTIALSLTKDKQGQVCAQFIETIQMIAYGETVYSIGERCVFPTPKLERT